MFNTSIKQICNQKGVGSSRNDKGHAVLQNSYSEGGDLAKSNQCIMNNV